MSDLRTVQQAYGAHGLNLSDVPLTPLSSYGPAPPVESSSRREIHTQPAAQVGVSRNSAREIMSAHYVRKSYRKASIVIPVLQGLELSINEGEFVSIIGASGCGK